MLRLHFTPADLAKVRIADRPYAQYEVVGAARRLQGTEAGVLFDSWRRRVHARDAHGGLGLSRVFDLIPRSGPVPAFLIPWPGSHDPRRWLDRVRATPEQQVRASLARHAASHRRPMRGWLRELADGGRDTLPELESTLRAFAGAAIEPVWRAAVASAAADRARRARDLLDGGLERLLARLPGVVSWQPPVLVTACRSDRDVHLAGRGLLLVPSYFGWSRLQLVERPTEEPLLVYPVQHRVLPGPAEKARRPLAAVLGQTRAAVLELIGEQEATGAGTGATTGELARRLAVAAGTISWHVGALREAGLVTTQRNRQAFHSLTPAGRHLLGQPGEAGFQACSNLWTTSP